MHAGIRIWVVKKANNIKKLPENVAFINSLIHHGHDTEVQRSIYLCLSQLQSIDLFSSSNDLENGTLWRRHIKTKYSWKLRLRLP